MQHIPDQDAVESVVGKVEILAQKIVDLRLIGGLGGILLAQNIVQAAQEVLGINAVAQAGDEADVGLVGAGEIENRKAHLIANIAEELLQAAALPCRHHVLLKPRRKDAVRPDG